MCLNGAHKKDDVHAFKTCVHPSGRTSLFLEPCPNKLTVSDETDDGIGQNVYERTKSDHKVGLSVEDRKFLDIMNREMYRSESGNWVAPLPFKNPRPSLPNNRGTALKRQRLLHRSLTRKPDMAKHYVQFMEDLFINGHAEEAPLLSEGEECWFLPHFGVYHPRKRDKIRVVFDSSSQVGDLSLNNVLLTGPQLMNSLIGVLLRFREGPVAIMADIQQMFHSFVVRADHRNFLRFLWHRDNKLDNELIEFRMKVHVFGNSPSPAVATFGLRKAAEWGEEQYGADAKQFVVRNFYVDDGLKATSTPAEAIDLLTRTQLMLAESNLRLHKIVSNSVEVMESFPQEDRANDLQNLDLSDDSVPMQRSLGICWDVPLDAFTFAISQDEKPYTRRGVLSITNSLYDPLGLVAPVTIEGKHFLRCVMSSVNGPRIDWDDPLPPDKQQHWKRWTDSLQCLSELRIPRAYATCPLGSIVRKELHVFSDASDIAIAACAYLRLVDSEGVCHVSFVFGKSKLAPNHATSTPRLELCAGVLAVEVMDALQDELDLDLDAVWLYSDSKVALGYIVNETRRFYVYVANRVERIRRSTNPSQWCYVSTDVNPADHATRPVPAKELAGTRWLWGPKFLQGNFQPTPWVSENPSEPDFGSEARPESVTALHTKLVAHSTLARRFERFSKWSTLLRAMAFLLRAAQCHKRHGVDSSEKGVLTPETLDRAYDVILRAAQRESYQSEVDCIDGGQPLPKDSTLRFLSPFLDDSGLLRVGGRLNRSDLSDAERHPVIVSGKSHIATLLVRHHHERVRHQGRHFTQGAVRAAGLWIVGEKRLINSVIRSCVKCRKLRGGQETQIMSDLPLERLQTDPPFTYVGLDVFGPWEVLARRTRGGHANSKRWAILFTCMAVRAVHIEVIEEMTASCTINAIRRFFAIRGPAKQMRSDNGSNFVGACNELRQLLSKEDREAVGSFLIGEGCSWVFNPPHSSHMGGVWERMIGVVRRVLDSMFRDLGPSQLTHEILVTFLAEASAIVNGRPLVPVSSDPEMPDILTPASLLTQKVGVVASLPPGEFIAKDMFGKQWRRVQYLSDVFWSRWRKEFLPSLQGRRKWQDSKDCVRPGDLVLVKDKLANRNDWPMGRVVSVTPSDDGKVRKVDVRTAKNGEVKTFLRPICDLVVLMRQE